MFVVYTHAIQAIEAILHGYVGITNVPEILDKPGQIYNMDETGMTLDPTKLKAVFAKGTQNPSCISSTTKSHR